MAQRNLLIQMMTYTRKIDLYELSGRVFDNIEPLLDSFKLEYKKVSQLKYCLACPIHGGDNETGLAIMTQRKAWACWTHNCHEQYGKNIYGLAQGILTTRNHKESSFREALKYISNIYGANYKPLEESIPINNNLDFAKIVKTFQNQPENEIQQIFPLKLCVPSDYFLKRNFSIETLKYFGVGETPNIKNRAMIPIHNENGSFLGYISRSTKPYVLPKFLFSTGLNKADCLYNYHNAIQHIKEKNAVILVEGQGDVWRLFEASVFNAVGCFGKDLSQKQVELLLKSGATNLIVLLDDDEAGREAKFKIQRQLHKLFKIKFPKIDKKDIGQLTVQEVQMNILPQIKGFF